MNVVITQGLSLMPPAFATGLAVWSSEDGTPGSATYQGAANAALVPADQDFAGCLELAKTQSTQKLRWMGQMPILPGVYLRVRARVKAMSGNLPTVRIAGYALASGGAHVSGLVETGPAVTLTQYGTVVEVSAIIGLGARTGVDMVWRGAAWGHVGLDLTGPNGGIVRIDDLVIEDVTSVFLRSMLGFVDVRDYGAVGDGATDDRAAFLAADADADGRSLVVPAGTYRLGNTTTLTSPVKFEGSVTLATDKRLVLTHSFDLPTYIDAFGGDEMEGFRRALQALLNFNDHVSLDMKGRRVEATQPIDVQAAEGVQTTWEIRRVICNGQFNVIDGPAWAPTVATSTASYAKANPTKLTNVANVANVPVGALVSGAGVGREVYVTDRNVGSQSLTLSQPLYSAAANQGYTFTRFKYVLDFSGFQKVSKFTLENIDFQLNGFASAVMLAPDGETFHLRDCNVQRPSHRGVTSIGRGCQDLQLDRCHFASDEQAIPDSQRISVAFNVNANDAKIRDSRFQRFGTTGVLHGNGHMIVGNHWFQGDTVVDGTRRAGMVFTEPNSKSIITGNYIDNCYVELNNEHDAEPSFADEYSLGGLTLTGNIFMASDAASWTSWIVLKAYGPGHFLHGLSVIGNTFKAINGTVDRVERVDTSIASIDFGMTRNVRFSGNTFNGVTQTTENPVTLEFNQVTPSKTWVLNPGAYLPFGGWARTVVSIVAEGAITNAAGTEVYTMPWATPNYGASGNQVRLTWSEPVKGRVNLTVRTDNPV
jgi:hypothetical protein